MSHNATRRAPAPTSTSLECPLASLGRNTNTVLDSLNGHTHHVRQYHHPLSSSPLDPQAYHQMSRESPSIEADDIVFTSNSLEQSDDVIDGGHNRAGLSNDNHGCLPDIYTLSRSSSQSSLDNNTQPEAIAAAVVQQKAATFELRGRHGAGISGLYTTHSSANLGRQQHTLPPATTNKPSGGNIGNANENIAVIKNIRNFLTLEHMLPYDGPSNAYLMHGNSADTEGSSDTTTGSGRITNRNARLTRHQGGRCSVPTLTGSTTACNAPYYFEKKMDALYLGNALRSLPLGAEANNFQSGSYYLEDGFNNEQLTDAHLVHHRTTSSHSETSGSDPYLLNRTNSPANTFNSLNQLDDFSNSKLNTSSSSNLTLDQRFHHQTKMQSLSDGLCNLGRFSPSLDQGYATLVSPSPTGHHPNNTITTHSAVHHPPPGLPIQTLGTSKTTANSGAAVRRNIGETSTTAIRPPPWNRKGPYLTGPYFDRLPDEAVIRILSWFDACELCNVARVCRRFEHLAWRPILWKMITLRGEHLNGDKTLKMIFRQLCGQSRNGSCPEVERVMLSDGCRISDKGLQLLTRRCPELTHLQLQTCVNISNQSLIDAFTKCTNLQHLDVTGCIQVTSISPIPNMEPPRRLLLQYLDLTDCVSVDDVGIKTVAKNCPQLVYLYLRRCIQITDAGLKFVPSFCVSLKELSVSDCVNITDFGVYELAKLGAALRYLSVAKCERVSDAGLKVIARRCYKLRYLNARGCEAVSDDSITVLARSCPRLRALDIGKCDVSDAGLRALAESCPNLKKLSLRNCDMITDRGVQCIAYYCRGLQQLNIQDCQISIEGYRAVKKYCKRCIIEHTNPGFC